MQRCTPTPSPARARGTEAGRGREAPEWAELPRTPLTWQKHLCTAVSGDCCSPWPERSSHTAPRRPTRKPQWLPIAALALPLVAAHLGELSIRAQAGSPQMKPAPAGPRRRPTSGPPPRPALGSPSLSAAATAQGSLRTCQGARTGRPGPLSRLPSPRVRLTNQPASRFRPLARRARPRPRNAGNLETRPGWPAHSGALESRSFSLQKREREATGSVFLQGPAPPRARPRPVLPYLTVRVTCPPCPRQCLKAERGVSDPLSQSRAAYVLYIV